jgi:hypothetical protein
MNLMLKLPGVPDTEELTWMLEDVEVSVRVAPKNAPTVPACETSVAIVAAAVELLLQTAAIKQGRPEVAPLMQIT